MKKYFSLFLLLGFLFSCNVLLNTFLFVNEVLASTSDSEEEGETVPVQEEIEETRLDERTVALRELLFSPSTTTRRDPPFFRLNLTTGLKIYFLGSIHPIPLRTALSDRYEKAHDFLVEQLLLRECPLLVEHKNNNLVLEQVLSDRESYPNVESWEAEFQNRRYSTYNLLLGDLKRDNIIQNLDEKTESITESTLTINDLFLETPWIAKQILSTHVARYSYSRFGGIEHDIIKNFNMQWDVLESDSEWMDIVKQNTWTLHKCLLTFGKSLLRLSSRKNMREVSEFIEKECQIYLSNYSWNRIYEDESHDPLIITERNKLWVKNLLAHNFLTQPQGDQLLIVVGFRHLRGRESFLKLLIDKLLSLNLLREEDEFLERFNCRNGRWKKIRIPFL